MRYLLAILLLTTIACSNSSIKAIPSEVKEPTREEIKLAMRYHGVLFAQQDDKGEWYFSRNGKRCRLFAYLEIPPN